MKWNNRLKKILAASEKSDFSADCLKTELRITANTIGNVVSAANRSDNFGNLSRNQAFTKTAGRHQTIVFTVNHSGVNRDYYKNRSGLAQFKANVFHKILNEFIVNGVTFDVSADNFQTLDQAKYLKTSDKEFLKINSATILCYLQQSLLMKHLFSHSPERIEDFNFEVEEREALSISKPETDFETYFEALKSTTSKWFVELLE